MDLDDLSGEDLARECRMAIRRLRLFPADPEAQELYERAFASCQRGTRQSIWALAVRQVEEEKQAGVGVERLVG